LRLKVLCGKRDARQRFCRATKRLFGVFYISGVSMIPICQCRYLFSKNAAPVENPEAAFVSLSARHAPAARLKYRQASMHTGVK
jgi:hypothetical protein